MSDYYIMKRKTKNRRKKKGQYRTRNRRKTRRRRGGNNIDWEKYQLPKSTIFSFHKTLGDKSDWEIKNIEKIYLNYRKDETETKPVPLTWGNLIQLWNKNKIFDIWFTRDILGKSEWSKFRIEFPPLMKNDLDRIVEFIIVEDDGLKDEVDPKGRYPIGFTEELKKCNNPTERGEGVAKEEAALVIEGVRGKSSKERMVIPCKGFAHIAQWARNATDNQIFQVWKKVSTTLKQKLHDNERIFLSTHGHAIPWLHIRIEDIPLHYLYDPYKVNPDRTPWVRDPDFKKKT